MGKRTLDSQEEIYDLVKPKFKNGDILIGYSYGGKILPLLAEKLEKEGKHVAKIIILDAILDEADADITHEKNVDIAFEIAKQFVDRFTNKRNHIESGVSAERIMSDLAHHLADSPSEYKFIHKELNRSFSLSLLNHMNPVSFRSKIRADISVVFTEDTLNQDTDQCLKWGTHTTGTFAYSVIKCDHNQLVTDHYTQVAHILMEFIESPCLISHIGTH